MVLMRLSYVANHEPNNWNGVKSERGASMKALLLKGPGEAVITELEQPSIGPEDVLIRSRAVGICGSDIELYRGIRPEGYYRYPVVPGHEWAGEVVAAGERVRGISPGDKVVAEGFLFCGTCRNCRMGLTNLCEAGYDEIGFTRTGSMLLFRRDWCIPSLATQRLSRLHS